LDESTQWADAGHAQGEEAHDKLTKAHTESDLFYAENQDHTPALETSKSYSVM
jgi:hypothetical protein